MTLRLQSLSGRIATIALIGAAVAHVLVTLVVDEYSLFAVVFELIVLSLAALAATRRWWGLSVTAIVSALLAVLTGFGQADAFSGVAGARDAYRELRRETYRKHVGT